MKNKGTATVTFPDGTSYTRNTNNDYAFAVVFRSDENGDRRRVAQMRLDHSTKQLPRYRAVVDSGVVPARDRGLLTIADYVKFFEGEKATIASSEQTLATTPTEPKMSGWKIAGFSTRRDLAQKVADKISAYKIEQSHDVQILPVVFVPAVRSECRCDCGCKVIVLIGASFCGRCQRERDGEVRS